VLQGSAQGFEVLECGGCSGPAHSKPRSANDTT
jgi:hypothetical protein